METLKASDDTRITYDEATGAVRSFFGVDLVEPPDASASRAGRSAGETTRAFLDANKDAFKLEAVTLACAGERKGSASTAVTYVEEHHGIPVYGGQVVVGVEQTSNRVASVVNHVDYEVPANLTREAVRVSAEQVPGIVRTWRSCLPIGGDDNSHFTTDLQGRPYIAFGEGGVPDAADAHVIVHEYGRALHFFTDSNQNRNGSEEGFGDFLAGVWLDRFNSRRFQRESVFPWDNNLGDRYSYMPFEAKGFACIGAHEGGDNPFYHRSTDVATRVDIAYLADVARMVLATVLTIAR